LIYANSRLATPIDGCEAIRSRISIDLRERQPSPPNPENPKMTADLFPADSGLEHLNIDDADISFARSMALPKPADELLQQLIAETPWRAESITLYGKTFLQPRLTAWYGDAGCVYTYSGIALTPLPWTPLLSALREQVQALSGEQFNSVLLNHYRDHRDSMGFHSDDERELGPQPTIASLSLGATRVFVLRHKARRAPRPVRIELPSGSLLVMKGETQSHWRHGIDKQSTPCGPRINLTFRRIFDR
jgi:alkylated DNA repair dioxygenase AlkB